MLATDGESVNRAMNLSTHHANRERPGFWSIGLVIIVSAVLAVLIEPLFPGVALAAGGDARPVATELAKEAAPLCAALDHALAAAKQ